MTMACLLHDGNGKHICLPFCVAKWMEKKYNACIVIKVCHHQFGFGCILSWIIRSVIYVGPETGFIRTTDQFIKDHLWSQQNHPDGKLVIIAQVVVLLTQMAKYCSAILPPCHAKEPSPAEASSCLDTDFTPYIMRLQQLVVLLHHKRVKLHHKSHFVVQLNRLPKNTGWSSINNAVVLNKRSDNRPRAMKIVSNTSRSENC